MSVPGHQFQRPQDTVRILGYQEKLPDLVILWKSISAPTTFRNFVGVEIDFHKFTRSGTLIS